MAWQIPEGVVDSFIERQLGISFTIEERKFLTGIKGGVRIIMDEKGRNSKEFQELAHLLQKMHGEGIIPSCQIVQI